MSIGEKTTPIPVSTVMNNAMNISIETGTKDINDNTVLNLSVGETSTDVKLTIQVEDKKLDLSQNTECFNMRIVDEDIASFDQKNQITSIRGISAGETTLDVVHGIDRPVYAAIDIIVTGLRKPVASPSDTKFTDSIDITLSSPDNAPYIRYSVNGGELLFYTDPITLTETSTIVAYADKDPDDWEAPYSEDATFTYTKVDSNTSGAGKWVLYKTMLVDGCSFYDYQCSYPECSASEGSYQITKVCTCGSTCGSKGSGTYTVPPSSLSPGEVITLAVSSNEDGWSWAGVCFYSTSEDLTINDRGDASISADWCLDIASTSSSRTPPSGEFTVPEGLEKDGVLLIHTGGTLGNFVLSMRYLYLYRWEE